MAVTEIVTIQEGVEALVAPVETAHGTYNEILVYEVETDEVLMVTRAAPGIDIVNAVFITVEIMAQEAA